MANVQSDNLQNGNTQSCGCLHKERMSEIHCIDLTGQKFGRLIVLEDVGRSGGGVLWRCLCECGNIVDVRSGNLQRGNTQSCGCYKIEQASKKNHWNWKEGITPLHLAIRTCVQYRTWRISVFQRDFYTCQHCNQIGHKLNAHHTTRFSKIMEEHNITTLEEALQCEVLWNILNGITLCKKCHKKEHARLKALDNPNLTCYSRATKSKGESE